jgi:malonyl-CoA O-methyltransferase
LADPLAIREGFNRVADRYDRHAALEQEVCARLLERCQFLRHPPQRILDLGCGTGAGSRALKKQFRRAQVIGLDSAQAMLSEFKRRSSLLSPIRPVCADVRGLPFAAQSLDLLFSSLVNHWVLDLRSLFDEYRRVLRPDGMLLFATFGPGTLAELHEGRAASDGAAAFLPLPDLMVIGDALMAAGFGGPVMDMETITVTYRSQEAMVRELESTGTAMLLNLWDKLAANPERARASADDKLQLTYEIIYGAAYGPAEGQPRRTEQGEVATFSVDSLLKSRPLR